MPAVRPIPPWLRRGLEAGIVAAVVAVVSLSGAAAGAAAGRIVLPPGPAGSLLIAPAILSIGVITVGYPVAYAATRAHAVLGSIVAFLVAGDLVAFLVTAHVDMAGIERSMMLG